MTRRRHGQHVRVLDAPELRGVPLHVRVYRQVRDGITSGLLKPGDRLPSARTLSQDLRVSRNTVDAAFAQLRAEGLVVRRVGAGTVVAPSLDETTPFASARTRRAAPPVAAAGVAPVLSQRGHVIASLGRAEIEAESHGTPDVPEARGFPVAIWTTLLARRARGAARDAMQTADACGTAALRAAITEQVRLTRGVRCSPEQVIVVSSTQQAIDLAARLLLDPGDRVAVENPGYPSARAALLASGADLVPIPVDASGLDVAALADAPRVRLVCVTPSHQYPTGVEMSMARRRELLAWAQARSAWIIEDDYDSEFRYAARPILSLQGMDRSDRVVYVGTFNKVMFAGLRLAYVIVPPALAPAFAAARRLTDGFSPPLLQAAMTEFLERGHFAAYLRTARAHYDACRLAMLDAIGMHWGNVVTLGPSDTGLHLTARLAPERDDRAICAAVHTTGLSVTPLSRCWIGEPGSRGLLLSYVAGTPASIRRDVAALAPAVRGT